MVEETSGSWLYRGTAFMVQAATENWGTKIVAFLLALIVFVVTRDEVTRSFTIPLRVVEDPARVLLTTPPETVELQVRGPWANVNRLAASELGSASLDLRDASPGPMALDPAAIVMPEGVVLDTLDYDPVDLRFEAVVERALPIAAVVRGTVDADHQLVSTRVEPDTWTVRAPISAFAELSELKTSPVDLSGVAESVDTRVSLVPLPAQFHWLGVAGGEAPTVRFVAAVAGLSGEIELEVATAAALREALPELDAELPVSERVTVRGPRKILRGLEDLDAPLAARVEVEDKRGRAGPTPVTLRFEWSAEVPEAAARQLVVTPALVRLRLSPGTGEPGEE